MSCQEVKEFIDKKVQNLSKDNDSMDVLAKKTPKDSLLKSIHDKAKKSATDALTKTPLSQLGEDYLSEQIVKNGTQIINNATKAVEETIDKVINVPVRKLIADAQGAVFNSISIAVTAQNDMAMYFLQQLAKNAVVQIQKKREVALLLQEKLRHLYNALVIMVNGKPFFSKYLLRLRQSIVYLYEAEKRFITVRSSLIATDTFLKTQFKTGQDLLKLAEAQLTPEANNPDVKFTDSRLLENVGVPSEPQQMTVLVSIPQLVKEVLAAANGYFVATFNLNLILLGFVQGLDKFQTSTSSILKNNTVSLLDTLIAKIDSLVGRMSKDVNGGPAFITNPDPNFTPDTVKVSSTSLSWLLEVRSIIEYANFVPGQALTDIQNSNNAVKSYQKAVTELKKKDTRVDGGAVLTATDGREEVGQLEAQIQTFCLASLQAINDATVASSILSLGRTLQRRIELTLTQDSEIEAILTEFINAPLPSFATLQRVGNDIFNLLDDFGLDRAASLLQTGQYEEFFNLNSKTATFAGAALVGIAQLKACLKTTEDQEQLTQAEREIQRENKSKELLAQRTAATGFSQQRAQNDIEERRLTSVTDRAVESCNKCSLPTDFAPPNMLKSLGGVLGISSFGNNGLSKQFSKLGKGIL